MSRLDRIKKKLKPLYRSEQTSLFNLIVLRFLTEVNCLVYQMRYFFLKREGRAKLQKLRESKAKNVFVFANGPSVGDLDFEKIKQLVDSGEFDLICVNSFASKVIKQYGVKPTVAVFADPAHYGGAEGHVLASQFQVDIEAVNESMIPALVPYRYFSKSRFKKSIPYSSVRNVFRGNVSDVSKPLGVMYLTALHALILAIDLQYENIYICGYDNSYFKSYGVDAHGEQYFEDTHFYDVGVSTKRYLPADQYGPTSYIFYDTYRHFKYLEKISRHGKKNVQIYNIAKTTYTNAFSRCFKLDVYLSK